MFLLRLSPVLAFNVLNYALGLTRVRYPDYLIASLGMLPGTLLYVYSGRVVGDLAALAAGAGRAARYRLLPGARARLLATAGVTVWVTRIARAALNKETTDEHDAAR